MRVKKITKTAKRAIEHAASRVDLSDKPKREKKLRGASAGTQVAVGEISYKQVTSSGKEMKLATKKVITLYTKDGFK